MMASQGYHSRGWSQLGMGTLPGSRATWVAGYSKDGCPGRWHPSCKGGSELKHPQQQLLTDSGKKASPSPKMSQSWPFQGQDAAALKGKSPPPSPQHPSEFYNISSTMVGGTRASVFHQCRLIPGIQTWGSKTGAEKLRGHLSPRPPLGAALGIKAQALCVAMCSILLHDSSCQQLPIQAPSPLVCDAMWYRLHWSQCVFPLPGENNAGPLSKMSPGAQLSHAAWAGTQVWGVRGLFRDLTVVGHLPTSFFDHGSQPGAPVPAAGAGSSFQMAPWFWTPAFGMKNRRRPERHLIAKASSRPSHTVGSHTAAALLSEPSVFPLQTGKGWGWQGQTGHARMASPLLCWLPEALSRAPGSPQ